MKRAFSMVELVFAIVLAGIAASVIPTIIGQSSKSDMSSLVLGELTMESKSMTAIVLHAPWDGVCIGTDDGDSLLVYGKIDKTNPKAVKDCGGLTGNKKALCDRNNVALCEASKANELTNRPSLDRDMSTYNGYTYDITPVPEDSGDNMLLDANISVKVMYVSDLPTNGDFETSTSLSFGLNDGDEAITGLDNSNLKLVEVTVKDNSDASGENKVTLRGYAANIGQGEFKKVSGGTTW